jgi:hypothetical protein
MLALASTVAPAPTAAAAPEPLDYETLLGARAWNSLPAATRARFAAHAARYTGAMRLRASCLGRCLAYACVLIGSPLPPASAAAVPAEVRVEPDTATGGSTWIRRYLLPTGPVEIRSVKALDSDGSLIERLGCGLRMRLDTRVQAGELHFVSTGYYLELGSRRFTFPAWSLPGCTHVVHQDLGDGRFRFAMTIRHGWLGELFDHEGTFCTEGE